MSKRPKSVIVLECLLDGQPIKFPGDEHTYYYQDGLFGVECTKTDTARPGWSEQVILGVEVDLPTFIKWCDKLTDDEVYLMGCAAVLRRMAQEKAERWEKQMEEKRSEIPMGQIHRTITR